MLPPLQIPYSLWWFLTMLLWLLHMLVFILASSDNVTNANPSCMERERQALLSFRSGLVDYLSPDHLLSSWRSEDKDCCRWIRVHCSQKTGHVTALDLSPKVFQQMDNAVGGEIGPSLLNLTHLSYLDLSFNNFSSFPPFIGSLNGLRYLNLSCSFYGELLVPQQLGNLSKLEYLALSGCSDVRVDTLQWISRLSSLTHLEMNPGTLPISCEPIMNLPSLLSLNVRLCIISTPSFPFKFNSSKFLEAVHINQAQILDSPTLFRWLNGSHYLVDLTLSNPIHGPEDSILDFVGTMTSLEHLDLSYNNLRGQIPMSWGNLCSLITLDLSWFGNLSGTLNSFQNWTRCTRSNVLREFRASHNKLTGPFDLTKFTSLEVLDVSDNLFNGSLSDGIWKLSNLTILDVSNNLFTGILPETIGKLSNLTVLDVHSNFLEGVISESHISKHHRLKTLELSSNSFKLNLSSNWVPPFQLDVLDLSSCKLGPSFPNWIRTQENLVHLDISNSGISDVFPSWFSGISDRLIYFNISHNNMSGVVPNFFSGAYIDLSNNLFDGPLPRFSSFLDILNLSKNKNSGNISLICTQKFDWLEFLDLSSNLLSGHLPDCWMDKTQLLILDLSNNDFEETIPNTMGTLFSLRSLRLNNNNFSGTLPSSFCGLGLIDLGLGGNQLSGKIPTCIGNISSLVVLELQSNRFWGDIPKSLCQLEKVHTLDLSLNYLSGAIPTCLSNLTAMAHQENQSIDMVIMSMGVDSLYLSFYANAWVIWKGKRAEYQRTLGLLKLIDLSSNKLRGEIPVQLASLYGLISLNLSSNKLTGIIPGRIGQLQQLDSLDLSNNELSGKIPESMSNISRLGYLDLSNNNLSGSIPSSTQMRSFNATAFAGNPGLCGLPLATKCSGDGNLYPPPIINHGSADDSNQEDEQWFKSPWFYGSVVLGYAFGFWGVCAPLVLYAPFRQAYFQFLNRVKDSLLLAIALKRAKLKRWLQS